jgi:hypothetical protein
MFPIPSYDWRFGKSRKAMNYSRVQLGPIYRTHGVPVVLTVGGVDYPAAGAPPLRFMDKTAGISLAGPGIEIETARPAAAARVSDILALGLTIDQLERQTVYMNSGNFRIMTIKPVQSPNGENDGEVYLFLERISS